MHKSKLLNKSSVDIKTNNQMTNKNEINQCSQININENGAIATTTMIALNAKEYSNKQDNFIIVNNHNNRDKQVNRKKKLQPI
jgi:hypothetical protein